MSLPLAARPKLTFYSQTVDGRPFVNCLPYSICPPLRWAGWAVPRDFGMTIRQASGVPVEPHRGTSYADMKRALKAIFGPSLGGAVFGKVTDAALLGDLPKWGGGQKNTSKDVYSVVCRMHELPRYLRRHVGFSWTGRHAIGIGGVRTCNGLEEGRHVGHKGVQEVFWMDPMGRTVNEYYGEWVPWSEVDNTLGRTSEGMIACVHAQRRAAHTAQ